MTIREIAIKTGLSTTTVCKALKNPEAVRRETLKRIESACGLPLVGSKVYAVFPDLKNSFFTEFLAGLIEGLEPYGVAPQVRLSYDNSQRETEIFRKIPNVPNQSIVWIPGAHSTAEVLSFSPRFPIVLCDRNLQHPAISTRVLMDNDALATYAVDYLLSKNSRKLCFLNGPKESSTSQQRESGAVSAAKRHRVQLDIFYTDFFDPLPAFQHAKNFLKENIYDAYLLGNQTIAVGFLRALKECGDISPPSCMTFDSIPNNDILIHPISYIMLPSYQMGQKAANLIMSQEIKLKEKRTYTLQGSLHLY